jgi:hypothetical protein
MTRAKSCATGRKNAFNEHPKYLFGNYMEGTLHSLWKNAGMAYVPIVSQGLDPATFQGMTGAPQVIPVNAGWDRVPMDPAIRQLFGSVHLIGQP